MKKLSIVLATVITVISMSIPAQSRVRIGPRVGLDVSSLHFNEHIFDKENRVGFTAGLQLDISIPFGFAVDASVMYVRRSLQGNFTTPDYQQNISVNRDYVNVPINLKWKLGLPVVGKIFAPYIYTGPDFAFLASKTAITDAWKSHKVDVSWNVGAGLELFSHLQVSATYGIGITKLSHAVGITGSSNDAISGKNNNWTVTAAWLF